MKKLILTHISSTLGIALVVVISAILGGIFLQEARSFMDPGSVPGASGTLAVDGGVIGNPSQGIAGAPTLFQGQKAIKDAIGTGSPSSWTCTVRKATRYVAPSSGGSYPSFDISCINNEKLITGGCMNNSGAGLDTGIPGYPKATGVGWSCGTTEGWTRGYQLV